MIEVTEDFFESVQDKITTISERASASRCENLLPIDVIQIKAIPMREIIQSKVEGFNTSGSPWKQGTLGAIMHQGNHFIGITSGHVHGTHDPAFDNMCTVHDCSLVKFIDRSVDVAFFQFQDTEKNTDNISI